MTTSNLTVRIGNTGSTGLTGRSAGHETHEVQEGLLGVLLLVLLVGQALLQELVDDEVDDRLTDAPPGGSQTLPEAGQPALGVDSPDHHGEVTVGSVQLESSLDQPDGVGGTGTDEACRMIRVDYQARTKEKRDKRQPIDYMCSIRKNKQR